MFQNDPWIIIMFIIVLFGTTHINAIQLTFIRQNGRSFFLSVGDSQPPYYPTNPNVCLVCKDNSLCNIRLLWPDEINCEFSSTNTTLQQLLVDDNNFSICGLNETVQSNQIKVKCSSWPENWWLDAEYQCGGSFDLTDKELTAKINNYIPTSPCNCCFQFDVKIISISFVGAIGFAVGSFLVMTIIYFFMSMQNKNNKIS